MGRSCRCLDAPAHPGPEPPQGWQSRPRQSKLRAPIGAGSSAVEHCLHTARVTSSNLVPPTNKNNDLGHLHRVAFSLCQHRASNPQSLRTLRCGPIRALCRHLAALNRGPIRFTARRRCIGCLSGTVPTQPGDIAMTLQAIRARQAQHVAAMRAVLNKATTEKRALAADEAHKCDAIKADIESLEAQESRVAFLDRSEE